MTFCLSTSDYNDMISGRRSPCPTEEEIAISNKNDEMKRQKIEEKLKIIPKEKRTNLIVFMKGHKTNSYVKQTIDVKICRNSDKSNLIDRDFEIYDVLFWYDHIHKDTWKGFDRTPFQKNLHATYLNVPYSNKEEAKSLRCRWDPEVKKWWTENTNENFKDIILKWGDGDDTIY